MKGFSEKQKKSLILIDNMNQLMIGAEPVEWLEAINDWVAFGEEGEGVTIGVGVNRDLIEEEAIQVYRESKGSSTFDHIYELQRNSSGYTKDVHGQLNIIRLLNDSLDAILSGKTQSIKNIKFRLTENKVEVFDQFVI